MSSVPITPQQRLDFLPFMPQKKTSDFGWSAIQVEDYKYLPPSDLNLPSMTHHILAFHYKPPQGTLNHYCADEHTTLKLIPRDITYVPAFADNGWRFGDSAPHCMHILMEHRFLIETALEAFDLDIAHVQFINQAQVQDKQLQAFATLFQTEVDNGCHTGLMYAESLATALASYILTHYTTMTPTIINSSKLNQDQLRKTLDYMNSHLHERITLRELAMNIHLSAFHFSRQFKQTMGVSPYRYWQQLRIDKIRHEISHRTHQSTFQIAQDYGFSNQSHFIQQFQQYVGITPNQYRKLNIS